MWGRTSRRFSAEALAMARKPAGWNPRMLAPNASTDSFGVPLGEHRRKESAGELVGGQAGQDVGLAQALVGDLRGEGTAPAGVGRGEDQRPRDTGVAAVERKGEGAAEGDAGDVGGAQAEP